MERKQKYQVTGVTLGVILLYTGLLVGWHLHTPGDRLALQLPGADNRPAGSARKADDVVIGAYFMRYGEEPASTLTGQWPSFRGRQADNRVDAVPLNLSESPFPERWSAETGEGHAAPVIYNGRVYFLDYDESLSSDALRCFSLESGVELWRRWYRVPMKRNHGFSRTVPAVGAEYLITIGPQGHVMCCHPETGDLRWGIDMRQQFRTEVPFWYTGQCPLVDGTQLILAPAGEEALLAGVDVATGEVLWSTPNTPGYKMSHSSVIPMTLHGKKSYVYIGVGGICGVSAEPADRGKLLWQTSQWQPSVVAPSPVPLPGNRIFMVAGYGTGGALLQVERTGENWSAVLLDQYKPNSGLSSEQQTPIFHRGMLLSVMPKDGGVHRGKLVAYDPSDLHVPRWSSSADERFGLGPYLLIGDHLFVLKDDGELFVYAVQPGTLQRVKSQRVMDGVDAWGPLAYADGRLILRDAHRIVCLQID